MAITLRTVTGSALTYAQLDTNFSSYYYSASLSGSSIILYTTGSSVINQLPATSSISIPSTSKWTDIAGGISRTSLVKVNGTFEQGNSNTSAIGKYSHAEGDNTVASGTGSHAEGYLGVASGPYSHAEGRNTQATGLYSHAEGYNTVASGTGSHAEGLNTNATGLYSHAEGVFTIASGDYSHAEGFTTTAIGVYSHAEGIYTVASGSNQHVQGQYNISSSAACAFIVGNGTSDAARSNLIFASGSQVQITGSLLVKDIIQLAVRTTTPTPVAGMIIASGSAGASILYYYNGTTWNALF